VDPAHLQQVRKRVRNAPTADVVSVLAQRPYAGVVLDIEGTTSPISFVADTLFPYARAHVRSFLERHFDDAAVRADLAALAAQSAADAAAGMGTTAVPLPDSAPRTAVIEAAVQNVLEQMSLDRKTTALKALQGRIWEQAYASGELRAVVFSDVPFALQRWRTHRIPVFIYSSGSVAAQKLLFRHTQFGDLSGDLAGYFDTTTGPKRAASSYTAIASGIGIDVGRLVFATDVLEEAKAARAAGYTRQSRV
jgi:2,3-diketo-5-methylthio-1-phosphopentane phosphatase